MAIKELDTMMWARACEAVERAHRLHRQFFHHHTAQPRWEAPVDVFETAEALTILVALPGVALDDISVSIEAGILLVSGERTLPAQLRHSRIHRMEIPQGRFERRIELPPARFELRGRHLADGCLMLELYKL